MVLFAPPAPMRRDAQHRHPPLRQGVVAQGLAGSGRTIVTPAAKDRARFRLGRRCAKPGLEER